MQDIRHHLHRGVEKPAWIAAICASWAQAVVLPSSLAEEFL